MAKFLLWLTVQEAKAACGTEQLAGGMEAGIEEVIHAMRVLCQEHSQEEDWGFLLIDERNTCNGDNYTAMLWSFRHDCPSCAQFNFN